MNPKERHLMCQLNDRFMSSKMIASGCLIVVLGGILCNRHWQKFHSTAHLGTEESKRDPTIATFKVCFSGCSLPLILGVDKVSLAKRMWHFTLESLLSKSQQVSHPPSQPNNEMTTQSNNQLINQANTPQTAAATPILVKIWSKRKLYTKIVRM